MRSATCPRTTYRDRMGCDAIGLLALSTGSPGHGNYKQPIPTALHARVPPVNASSRADGPTRGCGCAPSSGRYSLIMLPERAAAPGPSRLANASEDVADAVHVFRSISSVAMDREHTAAHVSRLVSDG
jgi:hypothetical protein